MRDLKEAETSLTAKNFKAAVVMSGAAVESMLLALLEQETNLDRQPLMHMGLHEYIELAERHSRSYSA
jgi:HEPN domain-containing protein